MPPIAGHQTSAHREDAEIGQVLVSIVDQLSSFVEVAILATPEFAVLQSVAIDVEVDAAFQLFGVETVAFGDGDEKFKDVDIFFCAVEVDSDGGQMNVFDKCCHFILSGDVFGAKTDSCGAAAKGVESEGVGFDRVFFLYVLTDVPGVAVSLLASCERELVGVGIQVFNVFEVFGAIIRLHFEPFDGFPNGSACLPLYYISLYVF